MKKIIFTLAALVIFLISVPQTETKASYHGPYYACYVEQNSTFEKCVGPFQNKYQCQAYRYKIPFMARWTGCRM